MTIATVTAANRGALEFLLGVEGIPRAFATNASGAWSGLTEGWTVILGALRRQEMRQSQSVNLANAELSASGMTFRLVDGWYGGAPYAISSLMTGLQAAITTRLTATLAVGAASIAVESSAAFAASGDCHCELETIGYSAKADGTHLGANLTRAKYGSKEVQHSYSVADVDDTMADFACKPEVTDRPVSWYGRHVKLYVAEVQSDGTLSAAECRWRGRITGEITTEGMEWVVPCEGIWDALSTDLLSAQATTAIGGIIIDGDIRVGVWMDSATGTQGGDFTVDSGLYPDANSLLAHITERLNAEIATFADPDAQDYRYAMWESGGRILARQVAPAGVYDWVTAIDPNFEHDGPGSAVLEAFFGQTENDNILLPSTPPTNAAGDDLPSDLGPATNAIVAIRQGYSADIPVQNASAFAAWNDVTDTYLSVSVVSIDGRPYWLNEVDVGAGTLNVTAFGDGIYQGDYEWLTANIGEPPLIVRAGVWMRGTFPTYWRDAFIDNAYVPVSMKAGLDSADIDWTDLASRCAGGLANERDRLLLEPASFRELFQEDLRWSGLVPIVDTDGQITGRPIANSGLVRDDGTELLTVDADVLRENDEATLTFSPTRVINRLEFTAKRDVGRPVGRGGEPPFECKVTVNDKASQGRYRLINGTEFKCQGVNDMEEADISAHALGIASSLFALTARDYPTATVGCLGSAANVLPMDCVRLTHWLLPSHLAANTRGITAALAIVTGVTVDWGAYTVDLDVRLLTDGVARSGFAPAARITAYTNNGASAGDLRYDLTVSPNLYSATVEGHFFNPGAKVVFRQWDDDTAPTDASYTVSPAGHSSDGLHIYLTSAPAISTGVLTLDDYGTASQLTALLDYLYVCDDADNLIGASGVTGYKLG